jgi:hypothetical protein
MIAHQELIIHDTPDHLKSVVEKMGDANFRDAFRVYLASSECDGDGYSPEDATVLRTLLNQIENIYLENREKSRKEDDEIELIAAFSPRLLAGS